MRGLQAFQVALPKGPIQLALGAGGLGLGGGADLLLLVGARDAPDAADTVARALRDLVIERAAKAATGREQQQRARRRQAFDPEPIATRVLELEGPPPDFRVLLGDLDPDAVTSLVIDVPQHGWAETVEIGASLLDQGDLRVNGRTLLNAPSVEHAHALEAALATDPALSGPVVLPRQESDARAAVDAWGERFADWRVAVLERVQAMLPGAIRARRRTAVLASVERQARALRNVVQ